MHSPTLTSARLTTAAVLAFVASGAAAKDLCLRPEPAVVSPGTPFPVALLAAEPFPGAPVSWRSQRLFDLSVTDARGRLDVAEPVLGGEPAAALLTLRGPGTAVIAASTDPAYDETPAAAFEARLRQDGFDAALRSRAAAGRSDAPGRERTTHHVKTLVNAGGPNASVALTRAGLALEIVPEQSLAALRPGGRLPVRVFYRGDPDVEDQVCVAHDPAGQASVAPAAVPPAAVASGDARFSWCGRLDGAGRASVPIAAAGWQMIRAARMIPIKDDPKADWQSFMASLTFRVEGEAAGGASGGTAR
jgi:hypothetical protein